MKRRIFYMNQGGGGQWGAVRYADYDLLLLAENSAAAKTGFEQVETRAVTAAASGAPRMSIQAKAGKRVVSEAVDLDPTYATVRVVPSFVTTDGVRIVFVHLKSANQAEATATLDSAFKNLQGLPSYDANQPTLWIGDFNRADEVLVKSFNARQLEAAGGQSSWHLDRIYISGNWDNYEIDHEIVTVAGADHGHVGISFSYERKSV